MTLRYSAVYSSYMALKFRRLKLPTCGGELGAGGLGRGRYWIELRRSISASSLKLCGAETYELQSHEWSKLGS